MALAKKKIGWIIILSREGDWIDLKPHLTVEKKPKPKLMDVPRAEKRTSGIKANFLWDKTAYTLGVNANPDKTVAKTQPFLLSEDTFNAFREKTSYPFCGIHKTADCWRFIAS